MGWYCVDEHMVYDPKWRLIARRAGASVSQVRDVFLHMMSDASLSQLGGEMASWNDEVIAVNMDIETEVVTRIKEAMQALILDGNVIKAWERRQPKRDYSTGRVREFRARQALADHGLPAPSAPPATIGAVAIAAGGPAAAQEPALPAVVIPPTKPSRAKPRRGIAENEQPDDKQKQAATDAGLSREDFRAEWAAFRDYHRARGSVMADWPATWRTWLRNKGRFDARTPPRGGAAQEDTFVKAAKKILGRIEDVTTGPGQVSAIASTLPDSAFGVAGDPFVAGSLDPDGSEILDLTPIRPGRPDEGALA